MKKHMNKLVPVAVAGLVFAGAGTVEASAAVAALPTLPEEEMESSERNETSAAPSTTIQAAVSGDPKPVEGGGTETDVSVNPKYDPENNTFTTDGSLTIKKDEDGGLEGITGTVTSPEVEVEFDEGEQERIEGEIQDALDQLTGAESGEADSGDGEADSEAGPETAENTSSDEAKAETPAPVDPEEEKELEEDIKDEITEDDGSLDWDIGDSLGDYHVEHSTRDEDDGTLHIYELTKSETTSAPLTLEELNELLGHELTKAEDNTYTYVNADGVTVTVTVDDQSTETTKTRWVIYMKEVTRTETSEDQTESIAPPEVPPVVEDIQPDPPAEPGEPSEPSDTENPGDSEEPVKPANPTVSGTLDRFQNPDGSWKPEDGFTLLDSRDKNGEGMVTIVEGNKTYEFEYKSDTVDAGNLTTEEIYSLLSNKSDYSLEDGKIYKVIDGVKRELSFAETQAELKKTTITISMKVTETITVEPPAAPSPDDIGSAQNTAERDAIFGAVKDAAKAQKGSVLSEEEIAAIESAVANRVPGADGSVTVTVKIGDTEYTVYVQVKTSTTQDSDSKNVTVESKADATITVDTEKEEIHGETEINVTDNMKYQLEALLKGDKFEDGTVTDFEVDEKGNVTKVTTTFTDETGKTTVKTYTFRYEEKTTTSDAKKYEDGEMNAQWDNEHGRYHFDLNGANAFVVKQSGGAVIWCSDPNMSEDELRKMFAFDGSLKNTELRFLIGEDATKDFNLQAFFGSGNNFDTKVEVRDGVVYVYGKDKLSHLNVGSGSITETTIGGSWNGTTTWTESTEHKGSGNGSQTASGKPGSSTTTESSGMGSQSWYEGDLHYTYEYETTTLESAKGAEKYVESERKRQVVGIRVFSP